MEAIPLCYLLNKLHLQGRTQHRFILNVPYIMLHISALSQAIMKHINTKSI